ncbi:PucR family transcriptional regulator [Pseudonocardia sp. T1-2H]|uniref:PucR family transcriptional regulator n=1 Tax=Pseudonocardia sp. T1-2H TaxID=3128899 RepID=UPI00310172E3
MADTTSDDVIQRCGSLVRLASASDSPEGLVVAASHALGRPLVLLDTSGAPLVASPPSPRLDASLGALTAAVAGSDTTPTGWHVLPIKHEGERLALLAVRTGGMRQAESHCMLDLVLSLLGEQFVRAALTSAMRGERRTSLLRRLVTDKSITAADIRAEGRAADLQLADYYWPALLVWTVGHPGPRTLAELHGEAQHLAGTFMVTLSNTTITLLIPARRPAEPSRETVHHELGRLVRHARGLGHRDVHAIADEWPVGVTHIPARVSRLQRLQRYLTHTSGEALVRRARSFALNCLLSDGLDQQRAEDFIRWRLCRLLRYDLDHGTDLAKVLELALDFPRRDDAAHASYMHRNTFRRHLAQALELVDTDLKDPDDRLTLHVALKLRRVLEVPPQGTDVGDHRGRDQCPADAATPAPHGGSGSPG